MANFVTVNLVVVVNAYLDPVSYAIIGHQVLLI